MLSFLCGIYPLYAGESSSVMDVGESISMIVRLIGLWRQVEVFMIGSPRIN
jgi:hypothetical protein